MREYNYQDMLRMQEEAAKRVREMKKRATIAVEDEQPPQKSSPIPDEVKHISYPVEIEVEPESEPTIEQSKKDGIIDFILRDKDALMILSLLAVLSSERHDPITTGALLYLLM